MPTTPRLALATIGIALAGFAIAVTSPISDANTTPSASAAAAPAGQPSLTVNVTQLQPATFQDRVRANGNIGAWQEASIGTEADGLRLVEVLVNVGDRVRRGQPLARFAAETVDAQLAHSRAAVAEADEALLEAAANAQRARVLQQSGTLSAQQIQQYLSAERTARARLDAARALERTQQLRLAHPEVKAVQAFSSALPLPSQSVRAVFCAQSFHWFATAETLAEIHRILQQDGNLVLIWNQRDIRTGWVKALADILAPLEGDTPRCHSGAWKTAFQQQPWFKLEQEMAFSQLHHGTVEQVVSKRLLSTSFIAALPQAQQQALKLQFEQAVFERSGKRAQDEIDFPYITQVYVFKKTAEK